MNKRIEELAKECYVKTGSEHTDHFAYWKFAEKIVRECMNIARQQRDPSNLNYKPSERFVEDLRQHFGVEE